MSEAKVAVPKAAQPKATKAAKPKTPTTVSLSRKKIGKNKHPKQKAVTKKDSAVQSKRDRAVASEYVAPSVKPGPKKAKSEKPKATKKAKKQLVPKVKKAKKTAAATTTTTGEAKTPVPESIKKKLTARQFRILDARKAKHQTAKKKASTKRVIYKRAEYYAAKYKRNERALIKLRRVARNAGGFFREPEPKIALVVRIRGINGVDPRTKKNFTTLPTQTNSQRHFCETQRCNH